MDRELRRGRRLGAFLDTAEAHVLEQDRDLVTWPPTSDDGADPLVAQLADGEAGPELARALQGLDVARITTEAVLELTQAAQRLADWAHARQLAAFAEAERRALLGGVDARSVPAEVSLRLGISHQAAARRVDDAFDLNQRHRPLWDAVMSGHLDRSKASVIANETCQLANLVDAGPIARLEERLAARGPALTHGRLRRLAREQVARLIPSQVADVRHEAARQRREVWMAPEPDGMALILARLPAADAMAIWTVIERLAGKDGADDERTRPQRRADVVAALFRTMLDADSTPLGTLPTGQKTKPHLLFTIEPPRRPPPQPSAGSDSDPPDPDPAPGPPDPDLEPHIDLAGYGPITTRAAARAVTDAAMFALRHDPETGERHHLEPLSEPISVTAALRFGAPRAGPSPPHPPPEPLPVLRVKPPFEAPLAGRIDSEADQNGPACAPEDVLDGGRITAKAEAIAAEWNVPSDAYRPLVELIRRILLRDAVCTFPTCRIPAWRCEVDHIEEFDPSLPAIDQTTAPNLHAACKTHHQLKTLAGWRTSRNPATGETTWTSPSGYAATAGPEYLDAC